MKFLKVRLIHFLSIISKCDILFEALLFCRHHPNFVLVRSYVELPDLLFKFRKIHRGNCLYLRNWRHDLPIFAKTKDPDVPHNRQPMMVFIKRGNKLLEFLSTPPFLLCLLLQMMQKWWPNEAAHYRYATTHNDRQ